MASGARLSFLGVGHLRPAAAAVLGVVFFVTGAATRKQLLAIVILAGLSALAAALTPTLPQHATLKAASVVSFLMPG